MKYLTVGKAAQALGVSKMALKKRRYRGTIEYILTDDGTYLYAVPEDAALDELALEETDFEEPTEEITIPEELHRKMRDAHEEAQKSRRRRDPAVKMQVSIYDAHVPFHDKATWKACLDLIKDEQPDEVILVGDFLDVSSMSSHAAGGWEVAKLSDEIKAGREAIRELRAAAGGAKIIYLEGNHESRPKRTAQQRLSAVVDLVAVDKLLGLKEQGIQWLQEGKALRRGKLRYVHGYWTGDSHAKTHLAKLMWPGVAYGHTHRPQMYSFADGDGTVRVSYGMPCMCELQAEWLRGQPSGWVNGFGVAYVDEETGDFNMLPVLAFGGKFIWNGKRYDGSKT
jgi:predicted phosphodiesterase